MPSIPQSLLWISLVVLWLFVLVPMLINKRETVRRTSDVALSTRVLNNGRTSRLLRRTGPAAGHHHDPDWRREDSDLDDEFREFEVEDYEEAVAEAVQEARVRSYSRSMMVVAPAVDDATTEPVYLDVDIVEESSGALPAATGEQQTLFDDTAAPEPVAEPVAEVAPEPEPESVARDSEPAADDYEYEYVEDTSGLEEDEEPLSEAAPRLSRRRRLDSSATAAAVEARKYRFRKRVLTAMAVLLALTAILASTVDSAFWWACGATGAVTVLYLAYLRRQTRIEAQVRRRRQQRMTRGRAEDHLDERDGRPVDADRRMERDYDVVPTRLRRPGAVVLDIDDEDPVFEHLDEVRYSRRYDLPRAAGQ